MVCAAGCGACAGAYGGVRRGVTLTAAYTRPVRHGKAFDKRRRMAWRTLAWWAAREGRRFIGVADVTMPHDDSVSIHMVETGGSAVVARSCWTTPRYRFGVAAARRVCMDNIAHRVYQRHERACLRRCVLAACTCRALRRSRRRLCRTHGLFKLIISAADVEKQRQRRTLAARCAAAYRFCSVSDGELRAFAGGAPHDGRVF